MKMSLYILILAFITSCGNSNDTAENNQTTQNEVIETSSETLENEEQQEMLVGKFTKEDLQTGPYEQWFTQGYEGYTPSEEALETIKNNISEYEIVGFMGTWCPDSRREVPKFFKLLDEAGYDLSKLTMVGVNRSKSTPENLEKGYDMSRVPTFIFMKDGKEVNRFVEYPQTSMEEDIAKIVSGAEYSNSYAQ